MAPVSSYVRAYGIGARDPRTIACPPLAAWPKTDMRLCGPCAPMSVAEEEGEPSAPAALCRFRFARRLAGLYHGDTPFRHDGWAPWGRRSAAAPRGGFSRPDIGEER